MHKLLLILATLSLLTGASLVRPASAQQLPRRGVIIVADGLSPKVVSFGHDYVRSAFGDESEIAFDDVPVSKKLKSTGINAAKKLLLAASAQGYRTGLVTTGYVAKVAPLFYGADYLNAPFSVIAGGGRVNFADGGKAFADKGNSAWFTLDALDEDPTGKILALQSGGDLSYSLDRDAEQEVGLGELVTLALQTLGEGDKPYLLVVHDHLLGKALAAKDTPAALAQFRELDGVLAAAVSAREENAGEEEEGKPAKPNDYGIAVVGLNAGVELDFKTAVPEERTAAFLTLSELPLSYAGAGNRLAGVDEAKLKDFSETYDGWKLSDANRDALLKGKLTGEAATRATYEPALKIGYESTQLVSTVWTLGWPGDFAAYWK